MKIVGLEGVENANQFFPIHYVCWTMIHCTSQLYRTYIVNRGRCNTLAMLIMTLNTSKIITGGFRILSTINETKIFAAKIIRTWRKRITDTQR